MNSSTTAGSDDNETEEYTVTNYDDNGKTLIAKISENDDDITIQAENISENSNDDDKKQKVLPDLDNEHGENQIFSSTDINVTIEYTDKQKESLQLLRNVLSDEINSLLTNDDCYRFLRARTFDTQKTRDMIEKWKIWYYDTPLPSTTKYPFQLINEMDPKEDIYRDYLPHSNIGEDIDGRPIYWEKTGLISSKFALIKKMLTEDEIFVRHVYQQEKMMVRLKRNSEKYNKLLEKQIIIFDMKNLSYSLDAMALRAFRRTITVDESCYPERLYRLYFINAPFFFTAVWAIIKPWLNPVTTQKINILGSNFLKKLTETINLDQIPIEYGGTNENFEWTWPNNWPFEIKDDKI